MSTFADGLRDRLLDGLPPRVCGMAEGIIAEWEQAVANVPELELLAVEDLGSLADLPAAEREEALRTRWSRLHGLPEVEVTRLAARTAVGGVGRTAAAR